LPTFYRDRDNPKAQQARGADFYWGAVAAAAGLVPIFMPILCLPAPLRSWLTMDARGFAAPHAAPGCQLSLMERPRACLASWLPACSSSIGTVDVEFIYVILKACA
jgi:hypothetical protein